MRILVALVCLGLASGCWSAPPPEASVIGVDISPESSRSAEVVAVSADASVAPQADSTFADLPDGFVHLRAVAPEIAQEMRYATTYNFVGSRIDGYVAGECILAEQAADAVKRVAADLARDGLGLKVYDCYRPQTAVNHFARWARGDDESMKRAFYPEEPRGQLFARGYIASQSGHSRGATVDLTLVRLPAANAIVDSSAYPDPGAGELPRCDRPLPERLAEKDLDMGTAYDCLSPVAATAYRGVSREARQNRQTLKRAMERRGLRNYSKEWWHFTLRQEPFPSMYFDFPVE